MITGRLGRRGAMLITLGITYLLLGMSRLVRPVTERSGVFHTHIPDWVGAAIWAGTGLAAVGFAFRRNDSCGWIALYLAPVERILSYLGGVIMWLAPGGIPGYGYGWYGALIYFPLIAATLICSGWKEPTALPLPDEPQVRSP